jgi:hypothetical protein
MKTSTKIERLVENWKSVVGNISDKHARETTAVIMENQGAHMKAQGLLSLNEDAATTVGKLGTFQKFAFPIVKRVYPELLANKICGVQAMSSPVSQVFYIGHDRVYGATAQTIYSKYNLTYRGLTAQPIGSTSGNNVVVDTDTPFDTSDVLTGAGAGAASATFGGQIAAWPVASSILGVSVSAGEVMSGSGIPELNFHIEQQAVIAKTRKMRALWTIEASQDLKAYHDMDLESELTGLLSSELKLEIDRELIEDLRGLAYNLSGSTGGFNRKYLDQPNSNNFQDDGTGFVPAQFLYDFTGAPTNPAGGVSESNLYVIDFSSSALPSAPQHVGHIYANLLALINIASQDIYRTTLRGPGSWILTSPLIASLLESASKLEGGVTAQDGPTNFGNTSIEYKGKFAGRYDLFVDPLYPTDEILVGYKGSGPMDAGFIYAPYIPLEVLPTVIDPATFQPRKGILTRYGKVEITPASRFYRVIRIVGPTSTYLMTPFAQAATNNGLA